MEILIILIVVLIVGVPLLLFAVYLEGKRYENQEFLQNLINNEVLKRNFKASNIIWYDPYYIATDLDKDKILIITHNNKEILNFKILDFHTTKFLNNGIRNDFFLYSYKAILIYLDENKKEMLILSSDNIKTPRIIKFSDILSVELIMDSNIISSKKTTNIIGRSVVGMAVGGNVGAIIGGVTSDTQNKNICKFLQLVITIRDLDNPVINIDLCNSKDGIKDIKQSEVYKKAQLLIKTFSIIIDYEAQLTNKEDIDKSISTDISKKITDLIKLKEQDVITEEEFLHLKQKVLEKLLY